MVQWTRHSTPRVATSTSFSIKGSCQEVHPFRSLIGPLTPDARRLDLGMCDACVGPISPAMCSQKPLSVLGRAGVAIGGAEGLGLGVCLAYKPGSSSWP